MPLDSITFLPTKKAEKIVSMNCIFQWNMMPEVIQINGTWNRYWEIVMSFLQSVYFQANVCGPWLRKSFLCKHPTWKIFKVSSLCSLGSESRLCVKPGFGGSKEYFWKWSFLFLIMFFLTFKCNYGFGCIFNPIPTSAGKVEPECGKGVLKSGLDGSRSSLRQPLTWQWRAARTVLG